MIKLNDEMIRKISIALTEFCFRLNGDLEDLHAEKRPITDKDMMGFNKYMVNHIAFILKLIRANKLEDLYKLLEFHYKIGSTWDDPEYDENLKEIMDIHNIKEDDLDVNSGC